MRTTAGPIDELVTLKPAKPGLYSLGTFKKENNVLAELQLLVDDVVMKNFPLNQATINIGRSPDNDIVIDEDSVSTRHARIDLIPNQLMDGLIDIFIEDLGSTNGTFVNQAPVRRQQLQNFDYIRIAFTDFKLVADKGAKLAKTTVILPDK